MDNVVGGGAAGFPFVKLEENSTVYFDHDAVTATSVISNAITPWQSSKGVVPVYTRLHTRQVFNATRVLKVDLSHNLLFRQPSGWASVEYSVQLPRASFVAHQLTSAGENATNVLEVELAKEVSRVVLRAAMDQSRPVL